MKPKWSILVCSIPTRYPFPAGRLWEDLQQQVSKYDSKVELIGLIDNFWRSVGEKRNSLVSMAGGEYISFIDDDDSVGPDYVERILGAIESGSDPDVITWWQRTIHVQKSLHPAGYEELCDYSLDYEYTTMELCDDIGLWRGKPAHTHCWKASIAKKCKFPETDYGEDVAWVKQAHALASTEVKIPKVLTTYRFDAENSETRGKGCRANLITSRT